MLFPTYVLCLVSFILSLVTPISAHPTSRFSHIIQDLGSEDSHTTHTPRFWQRWTARPRKFLEPRATRLRRRGLPGAVYICTDQNFRGDCSWIMPNNECHIPGTGEFAPESVGPDPGGFCILYEKATCTGNQVDTLRYPGLASNIPTFGGLRCSADGQGTNGTNIVQNGGAAGSGIAPPGKYDADPRLAGGVGSAERMQLQSVMAAMEEDGLSQGMIGLKKGHYY